MDRMDRRPKPLRHKGLLLSNGQKHWIGGWIGGASGLEFGSLWPVAARVGFAR